MADEIDESLLVTDNALGPQQIKKTKSLSKLLPLSVTGVVAGLLMLAMYNIFSEENPNDMTEEERLALLAQQEKEQAESKKNNGVQSTIDSLQSGEFKINQKEKEEPIIPADQNGVAGNNNTKDLEELKKLQSELEQLKLMLAQAKQAQQRPANVNNAEIQQDLQQRRQLLMQIAEMRRQGFVQAMTKPSGVSLKGNGLNGGLSSPLQNNRSGQGINSVSDAQNQIEANNSQIAAIQQQKQEIQRRIAEAQARLAGNNNTGSQVVSGGQSQALTAPTVGGGSAIASSSAKANTANGLGLNDYASFSGNWNLNSQMTKPSTPYMVRAGMVIQGTMISGVNSDISGQIIAQVSQNVYDTATGRHIMIPQGTRLVGTYNSGVSYGQERVMIAWQRLVFPDNKELDLGSMPGADISGYSGFEDEVNNHWWKVLSSAFLMSGIVATVSYATDDDKKNDDNNTSLSSEMKVALASQFGSVISKVVERNLNIAPTITIRPGYRFNIMVTKDLIFGKPYESFDY